MAQLKKTIGALFGVLYLLASLTYADSIDFHYCNEKADYPLKVSRVDTFPFPVESEDQFHIILTASTDETINGGTLELDYEHSESHILLKGYHSLCDWTNCPITSGTFITQFAKVTPIGLPGQYKFTMMVTGADRRNLTCISFGMKVVLI